MTGELSADAPLKEVVGKTAAALRMIALRGVAAQGVAAVGTIVLARQLGPHAFGAVALGLILVNIGQFVGDGGLGASLVRQRSHPTLGDLQALLALQLALTGAVAVCGTPVLWQFGTVGRVAAVMLWSLPLMAPRGAVAVQLERRLSYAPLAVAETVEAIAFYGVAVLLAAVHCGIWAVAAAAPFRAAVGTGVVLRLANCYIAPKWSNVRLRAMLGFGVRYQAFGIATILRDQGTSAAIAAVGGVTGLGVWNLALRMLQPPYLLFQTIWRVSYPAMSRVVQVADDVSPLLGTILAGSAVATGLIIAPLAGAGPSLVSVLVGSQWRGANEVIPLACAGLVFGGPISVTTAGFLWAVGETRAPLKGVALHAAAAAAVSLSLLPVIGFWALGLGAFVSSVVDSIVLTRAASRYSSVPYAKILAGPVTAAVVAGAIGWWIGEVNAGTVGVCAGGAVALAVDAVLTLLLARPALRAAWVLARGRREQMDELPQVELVA